MPYTVRRTPQPDGTELAELVRQDGSVAFTIDPQIDPEMFGHLCTPRWLDALNAGDGSVDEANKRVTIASLGKTWTARTEDQRDELLALRNKFAQELSDGLGITLARARFFCGWLWRFLKVERQLRGRL